MEGKLNIYETMNSGNLINHCSMNWAKFKDPVSHMCLAGAVVACWSLTQELQVRIILLCINFVSQFSENIQGNSNE